MFKFIAGVIVTLLIITVTILLIMKTGIGVQDLGIRISTQDSNAARQKVGTEIIGIKDGDGKKDFTLEGKKNASFEMDSKELTAHSNNRPWKNYPLRNLQIKIHNDGTIESSGVLIISKAMPYAMGLGYSESQIREAMEKYSIPQFEVPIYIKGKGQVIKDKVSVNAADVKIAMIPIPANIVSQANKEAEMVLNDLIQKHSHAFQAESVTFDKGKMKFVGQVAEKQYVLTE